MIHILRAVLEGQNTNRVSDFLEFVIGTRMQSILENIPFTVWKKGRNIIQCNKDRDDILGEKSLCTRIEK